jgi:hypothetical protein
VLIGRTTSIGGSSQTLARGELFQIPPDTTSPVEVVAVDAETGALILVYAEQVFELRPGQSRSFKQTTGQAAEITILTHTGRLGAIEPFPYGPDAR